MSEGRQDLAAMVHRILQVMTQAEAPVLRGHDLDMWEYVVLGRLEHRPSPTQSQLATAVGRDSTRLIPILDRLESRGLLHRVADPADRRNRVVTLSDSGRSLFQRCRASIRALEDDLLSELKPRERAAFITVLERLTATPLPASRDDG